MKSINTYLNLLLMILISGCFTQNANQTQSINFDPIIVVSPSQNTTYNINEIETNISKIDTVIKNNTKTINKLQHDIDYEKVNKKDAPLVRKKIDSLNQTNEQYSNFRKAWSDAGMSIKEFRLKHDRIILRAIGYYDFNAFVNLGTQDLISASVKLFGNNYKKSTEKNEINFYDEKGNLAVIVKANEVTDRIYEIRIIGDAGYYFLLRNSKIKEGSFRYIGFNISEIESFFGSSKLSFNSTYKYYYFKYGNYEVGFYADASNNYICSEMLVQWN